MGLVRAHAHKTHSLQGPYFHTRTHTGLLYEKYTHTCPFLVYTCAHPNREKITLDRKITPYKHSQSTGRPKAPNGPSEGTI